MNRAHPSSSVRRPDQRCDGFTFGHDHRSTVARFIPTAQLDGTPRIEPLIELRPAGSFTEIADVPGSSDSAIEKMTHPLAGARPGCLSPYMLWLLRSPQAVAFADNVLRSSERATLDRLGLDDVGGPRRRAQVAANAVAVQRCYAHSTRAIHLLGRPYLVQAPTKPYFPNQLLITPDFTLHRRQEAAHQKNLLRCATRDDACLYVDPAPIIDLKHYDDAVHRKVLDGRRRGFPACTQDFAAMAEYLTQFAEAGDIVVQNSNDICSDKVIAHWQHIPHGVSMPLLARPRTPLAGTDCARVDWELPTLSIRVNTRRPGWDQALTHLQDACTRLSVERSVTTTPVFQKLDDDCLRANVIFKLPKSALSTEKQHAAPGWLESCGIFIAHTPSAVAYAMLGERAYYLAHACGDGDTLLSEVARQARL